ncbi:protein turtle homolog A isoform X2 [Erythrolamprus reginae]|uniref:protein turtle homolog A isoform X2 n=1 Tax=Erythrolamprus reginae TaxID=121349 RepID=UPI00396C6417
MNWWLRFACVTLVCSSLAGGDSKAESRTVVGRKGETALLPCNLLKPDEARPPLYVIEWVRFGFLLPIFIKFGLYSPRVDPDYVGRVRIQAGASLQINRLRPEDQGWYECRVLFLNRPNNDDEFQNGTWTHLVVNFPPVFQKTPPALVEIQNQKSLTLSCSATGNPPPLVSWKRDTQTIENDDEIQVKNGTVFIARVERTTAGLYACHATNQEGAVIHTTHLLVQGPPVIVVPPKDITVNLSQDAFFTCRAEAYPANLTYSWFQGGTNVFHLGHLRSRIQILVDGRLLVQKTTPEDTGKFTCIPSNGLQKSPSASAFLTVLYPAQVAKMPAETFLPIGMQGTIRCPSRANPPLLSVSWIKDGQPLEIGKFPGWSLNTDGTIIIATSNDDALGVYACTPYNSFGTAGISTPTRALLKDPPKFTLRPKEEYFQEVGRELLIPCVAQGDPLPITTWTKVGSKTLANAQVDTSGSLDLRPLTKDQHGLWECAANNGVARVSATTSVYVLGTSPHAVVNISVWPLRQAVNVTWEPGFDGGYFQRFSIWYTPILRHLNRPHHDWASLPVPVGATHTLVENLQPDTSYQFSVLAQNKLGSGPFSEIISIAPLGVTTQTVPPVLPTTASLVFLPPPQSLRSNETTRGVLLLWEPPLHDPSALMGYSLELRQNRGKWEVLSGSIPSSETQFLVPGLIKDTFYEFRLMAFAGSYISYPSNVVNVSTTGMEVYPSRTQLPEMLPQPVLAGVIGGICFLSMAVIFSVMTACVMNRRRAARLRKRRQDLPIVFSSNKKLLSTQHSTGTSSLDSITKLKFQGSPYQSLRRTLLWGEKAGRNLSLDLSGAHAVNSNNYILYESHVDQPLPLERISRGPDGRFVVQSEESSREHQSTFSDLENGESSPESYLQVFSSPAEAGWPQSVHLRAKNASQAQQEAKASGHRQGRYFDYSSSSLTEENEPWRIVNISPVAATTYDAIPDTQWLQDTVASSPSVSPRFTPRSASPTVQPGSASNSAQSGILQYLSLPFFKEMNVDGDWPPEEEEADEKVDGPLVETIPHEPGLLANLLPDQDRTAGPLYMDMDPDLNSVQDQTSFLRLPDPDTGPAKTSLPGSLTCPLYLCSRTESPPPKDEGWLWTLSASSSPSSQPLTDCPQAELSCLGLPLPELAPEKHKLPPAHFPQALPSEKFLRGSLTSQSSGRGSASFLRPSSLATSVAGSYLSSPFGEAASCRSSSVGEENQYKRENLAPVSEKRRNTSVDENYEWDSEFALESELLDALQLYRSGDPKRPISTIAAHDLEKQSFRGSTESNRTSPTNSQSVGALDGSSSPLPLASPEERCAALREEFLAYRRRREMIQQRRQKRDPGGKDEGFEQATLF